MWAMSPVKSHPSRSTCAVSSGLCQSPFSPVDPEPPARLSRPGAAFFRLSPNRRFWLLYLAGAIRWSHPSPFAWSRQRGCNVDRRRLSPPVALRQQAACDLHKPLLHLRGSEEAPEMHTRIDVKSYLPSWGQLAALGTWLGRRRNRDFVLLDCFRALAG